MNKFYLLFCTALLTISYSENSFAQGQAGARADGLAGNTAILTDVYAAYNNPAGLPFLENPTGAVFYQTRYNVKDLSEKGICAALPMNKSAFALSYRSLGSSDYSLSQTGISYGLKLSNKFSAGIRLLYYNVYLGQFYGRASALSADLGFRFALSEKLILAGHLTNPNQPVLGISPNSQIKSTLRFGAGYIFSPKVSAFTEVTKTGGLPFRVAASIEYTPISQLYLRVGAANQPNILSFGFGWKAKWFQADFSTVYHTILGPLPQLSILAAINRKKEDSN